MHAAVKSSYKQDDELTIGEVGAAIAQYIDDLKGKVRELGAEVSNMTGKLEEEKRASNTIIKEKNRTIERLNKQITHLNRTGRKAFSVGETARFTKR